MYEVFFQKIKKQAGQFGIAFLVLFSGFSTFATQSATFQGRLFDSNGTPVTSSSVIFTVQVKSPGVENCLLYQESQTLNLLTTQGAFAITLGAGSRAPASVDGGNPLNVVFSNTSPISLSSAINPCQGGLTAYSPAPSDTRKINIFFDDGTGIDQVPTITMAWVPQATYAQNAGQLGGRNARQFLSVENSITPTTLTSSDYTALTDLILGVSTKYLSSSNTEGTSIPVLSTSPTTLTAGKFWYENGSLKFYDGASATVRTLTTGSSSGTVTSISGTPPIGVSGTSSMPVISISAATTSTDGVVTLATNGGTTANTVVQATDSRLNDPRPPTGAASGDLSGSYPNPSVTKLQGTAISASAPSATGQVLRYNGTSWTPNFLTMFDLRSTVTGAQAFGGAGCTSGQTLTWSAATDDLSCTNITVSASNFSNQSQNSFLAGPSSGGSGAASFRSIASTDLPSSGVTAGTYNSVTVDTYGRVTAGTNPTTLSGHGITDGVVNGGQSGAVTVGTSDANSFTVNTNGNARMTVLSNGNLGIGTTSPGTTRVSIADSASIASVYNNPLRLTNSNSDGGTFNVALFHGSLASAVPGDALVSNNTGNLLISPNASTKDIKFIPGVWLNSIAMTIRDGGNVGIGATNPTSVLQIAGNRSAPAWSGAGIGFRIEPATYTDTTSSGAVSNVVAAHSIETPTLAASNPANYTRTTTLRIAGAPTAGTNVTQQNAYALLVQSGVSSFLTTVAVGGDSGTPVSQNSLFNIGGSMSRNMNGTFGQGAYLSVGFNSSAPALTDTNVAGTYPLRNIASFHPITLSATNSQTVTSAATLAILGPPVAGLNVAITNPLAFQVSSGNSHFAGNVGIGTTSPSARLDVADTGTTTSAIIVPRAGAFTGTRVNGMIRYNSTSNLFEFAQNGAWVNYTTVSDARLKTNVVPVTSNQGLDIVNQLNPVFYDWDKSNPRTETFGNKHQVGFIAQEVEKVLPEVVDVGEDSYRSVQYGKIVSVVVAAVKELYSKVLGIDEQLITQARQIASKADKTEVDAKLEAKNKEIADLKAKASKAEQENAALKARLDKIEKMLKSK